MANGRVSTSTRLMTSWLLRGPSQCHSKGKSDCFLTQRDGSGGLHVWSCFAREVQKTRNSLAALTAESSAAVGLAGVDNCNACHGKLRHVDKDWRTVYGGLMVGCWRRLACVQLSCFCFCVSSQAELLSGGSIHGSCQCVPTRGVSHHSCSRRRQWNTHDARGLNTEVGRSQVFQRGVPPGTHREKYCRCSQGTDGESVDVVMRQFQEELFDKWSTSFRCWLKLRSPCHIRQTASRSTVSQTIQCPFPQVIGDIL